jgi:hypothetical protein
MSIEEDTVRYDFECLSSSFRVLFSHMWIRRDVEFRISNGITKKKVSQFRKSEFEISNFDVEKSKIVW